MRSRRGWRPVSRPCLTSVSEPHSPRNRRCLVRVISSPSTFGHFVGLGKTVRLTATMHLLATAGPSSANYGERYVECATRWHAPVPSINRQMKGGSMEEQAAGISRRRMLKRIGAGAAVAWSAPVLTSLRTPAFAQGSPVCAPGCPQCQFGAQCRETCACVGVPDCFCSDLGTCFTDRPICATDADCEQFVGPGGRCAPCVFDPSCVETSCWRACGQTIDRFRTGGPRVRVVRR